MPSFDISYEYDAAGNRTKRINNETSEETTYTYDAANRLTQEEDAFGITSYEYDGDGNRTKKEAPAETTFYEWDQENHLISAEPASGKVTLTYNGDGQRVKKETPAETTKYIYDFKNLLQEADGNDDTQHLYTQTNDEYGELVSEFGDGSSSYFQYDALGNTDALLDADESVTDQFKYSAFGLETHASGSSANPFTFVGKSNYYHDPELELYLLGMGNSDGGGRNYDPSTGAFISEDPAEDDSNLYRYVHNNPVNAVDPSGQEKRKVFDDDLTEEFANIPEDDLRRLEFVIGKDRETIRKNLEARIRRLNELTQEPAGKIPRQVLFSDLIQGSILELEFQRDNIGSLPPLAFEGEGETLNDGSRAIILPPFGQLLKSQQDWLEKHIRLPWEWNPPNDPPETLEEVEREIDRLATLGAKLFREESELRVYDRITKPKELEEYRRKRELLARAGICWKMTPPTDRYSDADRWRIEKDSILRRYVFAARRHWLKRRQRMYNFYIWMAQFSLNLIANFENPHARQMFMSAAEAQTGAGAWNSLSKAKSRIPNRGRQPVLSKRPTKPTGSKASGSAKRPERLQDILKGKGTKQGTPDIDAPRTKHWTDFRDETARLREQTIRNHGLNPDRSVRLTLPKNRAAGIKSMARKADIKAIDRIVKKVGLTKGQRRLLHDEITGQNFSLEEIQEIAREIKKLYPNK